MVLRVAMSAHGSTPVNRNEPGEVPDLTIIGLSLDAANSRGAPKTRPCLEFQFVGVDGSAIDAKVGGSWPVLTEIKALFEGT